MSTELAQFKTDIQNIHQNTDPVVIPLTPDEIDDFVDYVRDRFNWQDFLRSTDEFKSKELGKFLYWRDK